MGIDLADTRLVENTEKPLNKGLPVIVVSLLVRICGLF